MHRARYRSGATLTLVRAAAKLGNYRNARLRIGLLGGSFNPAHDGHRHLSLLAIRCLRLDAVWWLVSPQNPLKPKKGMAPLKTRLATARAVAAHPRLVATDIETELGTVYTAETLMALRTLFPKLQFVWLMGADNLSQIDRWEAWEQIFHTVPIAVFARPSYSVKSLSAKAAHRFQRFRLREREASRLGSGPLPRWVFLHTRLHPASASLIRAAARDNNGKAKKGRMARFRGRIS